MNTHHFAASLRLSIWLDLKIHRLQEGSLLVSHSQLIKTYGVFLAKVIYHYIKRNKPSENIVISKNTVKGLSEKSFFDNGYAAKRVRRLNSPTMA